MIDWAALVADSALNLPNNEAKTPCSDKTCPNKPENTENVRHAETRSQPASSEVVRTSRTVRTTIEGPRVEDNEKHTSLSFIEPEGDGVKRQSAPHKKACEPACQTCAHLYRPGLSDGHCGGRDDLPFAYTPGHPLRQLPADGGVDCSTWKLHPALDGADLSPSPSRVHRRP
jgi:hypothetical protein